MGNEMVVLLCSKETMGEDRGSEPTRENLRDPRVTPAE